MGMTIRFMVPLYRWIPDSRLLQWLWPLPALKRGMHGRKLVKGSRKKQDLNDTRSGRIVVRKTNIGVRKIWLVCDREGTYKIPNQWQWLQKGRPNSRAHYFSMKRLCVPLWGSIVSGSPRLYIRSSTPWNWISCSAEDTDDGRVNDVIFKN